MNKRFGQLCRMLLCMLAVLLLSITGAAAEEETVTVRIPALALGADCDVALFNTRGERVQKVHLSENARKYITLECTLSNSEYRAQLINQDNDEIVYDRTIYWIRIGVFYGPDGKLDYSLVIEKTPESGRKDDMLRFINHSANGPQQDEGYDHVFTFRKLWKGGHEDDIFWTMYNADGSVRHKWFNKTVVSENEWFYVAYFKENVDDCYIIEQPSEGYSVTYQNVGPYAHVTDRCHNGGIIINYKVPQTDDIFPAGKYVVGMLVSGAALVWLFISTRRRSTKS